MSIKYRIVKKKVRDPETGAESEKNYAQPVYNGYATLQDVCNMVSMRSSMSSADVKSVLDSLTYILGLELSAGRIVETGELGNFRISLSSEGATTEEDFSVGTNMRDARILFTPGKNLRTLAAEEMKYEQDAVEFEECDLPHME